MFFLSPKDSPNV